jgi:outer membrane autotransporter protein
MLGTALLAAMLAPANDARATEAEPEWTLTKTPNPTTFTAAGQVIQYTYRLTSSTSGTGTIQSRTDNKIAVISCPSTTVPPNGTVVCTGSYTTTAADVQAGSVTNNATFSGDACNDGCDVTARASATITFVAQPSWTLSKTASPTTYAAAGQAIGYSYLLTNTGNVTITSINLNDNKVSPISCPATFLPAGSSMTCTGSYTTTAADVSNGSVTNIAAATGTPAKGDLPPATATATIRSVAPPPPPPANGSITIVKTATGGNQTFNFTSSIASAASFTLVTSGGTASRVFSNLSPGSYTFTEVNLPLNWTLSSLTCSGDNGGVPTTVNVTARSVSVGLDSGEAITCTFTNVFQASLHIRQTQDVIQGFLFRRLQLLTSDGPDRNRFLRRLAGVLWGEQDTTNVATGPSSGQPLAFSGSDNGGSSRVSFATSLSQIMDSYAKTKSAAVEPAGLGAMPRKAPVMAPAPYQGIDVWVEGHMSEFRSNLGTLDNRGHFNVVYLGADYVFMQSVLIGALVQYDWTKESSAAANSAVDGQGWMAGPYATVRLTPNLYFDARGAWGTSHNSVNPFGLYQDRFATDRWIAQASLTGNWWMGNFRVTPSAGVTYAAEQQRSYTDSLGVLIPDQTVKLGRLMFGPEFAYRIMGANGVTYEPLLAVKGIWDFVKPDTTTVAGYLVSNDSVRALAQAGILARAANGYAVRIVGQYDGIGSNNFRNYGGQVWINIPLH